MLVLTDALGWFWVVGLAAVVFVLWWAARRYTRNDAVRQATSTLALSQVIPLVAPLVFFALVAALTAALAVAILVVVAVAAIAVGAFVRRRR